MTISKKKSHHEIARVILLLLATLAGIYVFFWILGHLLAFAPEPIGSRAHLFIVGARMTLALTIVSGFIGLFLGMIAGLMKLSRHVLPQKIAAFYIWIIRGTPLLVQILFVYYALPVLIPAFKFSEFAAAIVALSLNVGAYNAEVIRAGVLAVPKGQIEASRSLGLSGFKTMRWVVMPQALRMVIPPLVNNVTALLKDSSLVSSIGLLELTLTGNRISSETFQPAPVLFTVACVYLALTTVLTMVAHVIEKRMRVVCA